MFGVFQFTSGTYFVIRGSADSRDWAANLAFDPLDFLDQKDFAHKGFVARAMAVPLAMISRNVADLVVTGHSQGGAVAVLAAAELMHKFDRDPLVFTFAQPSCFYKPFPEHMRALKAKVKTLVHRFSFDNDGVPTASDRSCGGGFPENLVCLSDTEPYVSWRSDQKLPVPGIFQFEKAKHDIDRHWRALLNAACLSGGARPNPRINEVHTFPLEVCGDLQSSPQSESAGGGRFLLEVCGRGKNVHIVSAGMCQIEGTLPIEGVQLINIENRDEQPSPILVEEGYPAVAIPAVDCEMGTFKLTFDVTNANFNGTTVAIRISNGFHTVALEMPITLNNVIVFGKAGHGKSTLVRAMKACAEGQRYPEEVPRDNLGVNPESKSESFTKDKLTVYEVIGVGNNDDVHRNVVQNALTKFPPRVVVIVWKFGETLDDRSKDFHDMVRMLLECLRNHQVQVLLVLTQCDKNDVPKFRDQYEKTAEELKEKFGMSPRTRHFIVNSADARGDPSKVHGISDLYAHVKETLKTSIPLQGVIRINSVWNQVLQQLLPAAAQVGLAAAATCAIGPAGARAACAGAAVVGVVAIPAARALWSAASPQPTQRLYQWMYGDASTGQVAELAPYRWSSKMSAVDMKTELQSLTQPNQHRPFILEDIVGRKRVRFARASEAIAFLST